MHGRGIRYRLQGYVPTLGQTAANAFDLQAWQRATSLEAFGIELFVRTGAVTVSLRHFAPDGTVREHTRLDCPAPGSAFSPPIFTDREHGALLPVVQDASQDADYDIFFGTNESPLSPQARVAFLLDGRGAGIARAMAVFRTYLAEHAQHGARDTARLVIVDRSGGADPGLDRAPDSAIRWLPGDPTDGSPGTGRGLYAICYGGLATEGFSHVCLLHDAMRPHPEMFARAAAFLRFLRPGMHVCAPVYDAAPDAKPGRRCLGFGGSVDPGFSGSIASSDAALDPVDLPAFLAADRTAGPAGWEWCGLSLHSVYRHGLPYPFCNRRMAALEYGTRLRDAGLGLVVPLSFWAERDGGADAPLRHRDVWAMLAMHGRLGDTAQVQGAFAGAVRDRLDRGEMATADTLMQDMDAFLNGPGQIGGPVPGAAPRRPPDMRLQRQLRQLGRLPTLTKAYASDWAQRSALSFWARQTGTAATAGPARDAELRDWQLSELHLKIGLLHRQQQSAVARRFHDLEDRLRRNRLLDTDRVHADQDRANRVMLSLLRNRHQGRRAVIVGNGPSLRIADLNRLQDEVTFASNKIYLAYDETPWRPTYYSVEDHLVIQNNRDRIAGLAGSIKIFPANVRDFGYHAADTIFVPFRPPRSFLDPLSDPEFPDFSADLSHGICWGSTIVYSQIQMAVFMGCANIYLVGLDHSYKLPSTKVGQHYLHEGEQNHFHPAYREIGEAWHQPNLDVLEVSYARARDRCAARGVRIFNASRQTSLDVFDRASFDAVFPPQAPDPDRPQEKGPDHDPDRV